MAKNVVELAGIAESTDIKNNASNTAFAVYPSNHDSKPEALMKKKTGQKKAGAQPLADQVLAASHWLAAQLPARTLVTSHLVTTWTQKHLPAHSMHESRRMRTPAMTTLPNLSPHYDTHYNVQLSTICEPYIVETVQFQNDKPPLKIPAGTSLGLLESSNLLNP